MQLPFQINLSDKVVVVTGGSGVIGSVFCKALALCGAKVAVLGRNHEKLTKVVTDIQSLGGIGIAFPADVLNVESLNEARIKVIEEFGGCDILINAAGGNHPSGTTSNEFFDVKDLRRNVEKDKTFFDLDPIGVEYVLNLNFLGTFLPSQVFGRDMIEKEHSVIINISSMNAFSPLTKIPAYSGAKAAVSNFTQWLAVHMSKVGIRVNAIAPGFYLTQQNEKLLLQEDGSYTRRAKRIIEQTPMERFGNVEELIGTLLWLVDQKASSFVNGIVVPVDGGFSAYSGV